MNIGKSMMALISSLQRKSFVFLWLGGKTQPWAGNISSKASHQQMFHFSLSLFTNWPTFSFFISWIFKFCPLSQKMSASRFLSPKVGEFMRLSRNIISIFVDFLPPGMGGGMNAARLYGNSTFLRKLGSLLKSGVLLDCPFLRVMNFTSALNPTERYIYWSPPSCLTPKGRIKLRSFIRTSWMIDFKGHTFKPHCAHANINNIDSKIIVMC